MVRRCPTCGYNNRDDAVFCSSCGTSLTAPGVPALKPVPSVRVVTPVTQGAPVRVPAPGMCYYHPNLPAVYVCNRCGRAICRDDSKAYMDLMLCPQCYAGIVPPMAPQMGAPYGAGYGAGYGAPVAPFAAGPAAFGPQVPGPVYIGPTPGRSLWGFILSMVAGILVIINAAALLATAFFDLWKTVFFWIPIIDASATHGLIFAIGAIIGLILVVGSILMILGYGTIGSIVVFPLAVLSLIIGGGFVAGFVLGVVGGILGMVGR